MRTVQPHIALALLLGIVERMGVKKRPDELPTHVFEAEFEMRVLVNGVMSAEIGSRPIVTRCFSVTSSGPPGAANSRCAPPQSRNRTDARMHCAALRAARRLHV